jgi:hypothetical protein
MEVLPIACPACGQQVLMAPGQFGMEVSCTHCQSTFRMSQFTRVPCPNCHQEVRLRPDYIGERVTCKFCNRMFLVQAREARPAGAKPSPPERAVAPASPADGYGAENPANAVLSSQMIVRLDAPPGESPAPNEARRLEKTLRKELNQARGEVEQLRVRCAELERGTLRIDELTKELEDSRVEARQLRADLEANANQAARADQLARELEGLGAERDQLLTSRSAAEAEAAKFRQEADERHARLENQIHRLEQDRAAQDEQLRLAHQTADVAARERDEARLDAEALKRKAEGWASERQALLDQWHRDHHEKVNAIEQQLREEQTRQLGEREAQLETLRNELEQQRQALSEALERGSRTADELRAECDAAREQSESIRRQNEAEQQVLRERLTEVGRTASGEQERLNAELGRADAARRQLEQERQTLAAEGARLRKDLDAARLGHDQARAAAEEQQRRSAADAERDRAERDALRQERDAAKAHAARALEAAEKEWQERLAAKRRDSDHECEMLRDEASRQQALAESLRHERDALRRRVESLQQQSRERTETWESERQAALGKILQGNQQLADFDKRYRCEQATVAELRSQLEAARQTAPGDVVQLRQDLEILRHQLDEAAATSTQSRQQADQRSQAWTVEKRSLHSHHEAECRLLGEEFDQRLKVELERCRESYADQIDALQRERDAARAHFEALKQATYHPDQAAEEDDGIPRLPEPEPEADDEDRSALEQRLIAEQAQLQAALRKSRQMLDDQRRQFEEERQALLAEVHRIRPKTTGGVDTWNGQNAGTAVLTPRRRSWKLKLFLYLVLFLLVTLTAAVVGRLVGRG